jgi:hypothetical protein
VCWYDKTIQHRPVEIRIAQAGPSPFWIEYNGSPLLDEKGRTRYFHSAKEAETAAKELKTPTKK